MNIAHTAKVLIGKALRPLHAGEDKLVTLQRELTPARDMLVHSDAFALGATIPRRHVGGDEGDNLSPPLSWSGVPRQTRELILVCEDPDAPARQPFVHWVVRRIPPEIDRLPEGIPPLASPGVIPGLLQAMNGLGEYGWVGPTPPPGHGVHHYYFELFALDQVVDLPDHPDPHDLVQAMTGHVLAHGHHVGTYERT